MNIFLAKHEQTKRQPFDQILAHRAYYGSGTVIKFCCAIYEYDQGVQEQRMVDVVSHHPTICSGDFVNIQGMFAHAL